MTPVTEVIDIKYSKKHRRNRNSANKAIFGGSNFTQNRRTGRDQNQTKHHNK